MHILFGTSPSAITIRYRLAIIILLCTFFYLYYDQQNSIDLLVKKKDSQIEKYEKTAISLSEKLRVIWIHKNKLEQMTNSLKIQLAETRKNLEVKHSEIAQISQKCQERCPKNEGEQKISQNDEKLKEDFDKLKREDELTRKELDGLKEQLTACQYSVKKMVGETAVENYSQNETAHFKRSHVADAPLAFDRGNIQNHLPNVILSGKQLAETLERQRKNKEQEKEQLNLHPQDRDVGVNNNEIPDANENDYKEH